MNFEVLCAYLVHIEPDSACPERRCLLDLGVSLPILILCLLGHFLGITFSHNVCAIKSNSDILYNKIAPKRLEGPVQSNGIC